MFLPRCFYVVFKIKENEEFIIGDDKKRIVNISDE